MVEITEYRSQLYDYLKSRMMAVAPNVTVLVGEFVGAKLVAQAGMGKIISNELRGFSFFKSRIIVSIFSGSMLNLAKHPASTVQILGAEKALFRALKTKKETPKYGFIYNSPLIGQASTGHKGKVRQRNQFYVCNVFITT